MIITLLFLTSCANGCAGSNAPPSQETKATERKLPVGWVAADPNAEGPPRAPVSADKAGSVAFARKNERSPLGVNLRFVSYSSTDWPFLDLVRMGSPWISRTADHWDDGRPLKRDAAGWIEALDPGQWAATIVPTVVGGRLVVLWKGNGNISVENARILEQRPNRILIETKPREQIVLNLTNTDPKDYVREVSVVPAEYEEKFRDHLFHPLFLERLAPFSVIRFLEWIRTNGSQVSRWEDRTLPTYAFQSLDSGVAYEHMIALVNQIDADIWIPIPHLATNDHVRQLAELLLKELEPERRVYVEWSNEVWNDAPAFTQAQYARAEGLVRNLDPKDGNVARLRFQAQRSVEIFDIFEEVFKDRSRLVRVIGSQTGNAWAHEILLKHANAYKKVDALAIAPYFGHEIGHSDREGWLVRSSTEEVLDHLEKVSLPEVLGWIRDSAKVAKKYELDLIAYEGGQHLVASPDIHNNPAVNDRMDDVNRHPRMKALTLRLLQGWRDAGGKTFAYYAFTGAPNKWGRFGALEFIDQPVDAANKYDALLQFVEANPRWW